MTETIPYRILVLKRQMRVRIVEILELGAIQPFAPRHEA